VVALETGAGPVRRGYLCLLVGALLIVLQGKRQDGPITKSNSQVFAVLTVLCIVGSVYCAGVLFQQAPANLFTRSAAEHQITLWACSIGLCLIAAYCWDMRSPRRGPSQFDKLDYALAFSVFILAFAYRMVGPFTAAGDEALLFGEMRSLVHVSAPPWSTSATSYPFLFHWLIFLVAEFFDGIIEPLLLEKLLAMLSAATSVAALYFIVRLYSARHVALCASLILTFLGWHWVNSRLIYLYPYDMALLTIGVLFALIAFRTGRLSAAVVTGVACALAIVSAKMAIMMLPFIFLIFVDFLRVPGELTRRETRNVALVMLFSSAISFTPYASRLLKAGGVAAVFARFGSAGLEKKRRFSTTGASFYKDFFLILKDAFYQLQVSSYDISRHYFRPAKPLLDPIASALTTIGFFTAIQNCFQRREWRIALVGMFVFMLPMILAFPLDSPEAHGLSRRMVGSSFFIAWLAALGADTIASRIVRESNRARLAIALCCLSALSNVYFLFAVYLRPLPYEWYADRGLHRFAMIRAARLGGERGIKTIVLENDLTAFCGAVGDLTSVKTVTSADQVREALRSGGPGLYVIIASARWAGQSVSTQLTREQLADVIPSYLWVPGDLDPVGAPMFDRAYVYVK
jgi:hypothetical protein